MVEPVRRFTTRRKSVFAEAYDPENDADDDEAERKVYPKSDEQRARLTESVKNVLLFRSLDDEQMNQVLDAMFEKRVQPDEFIIRQGDDGDNFYVIESGVYKVICNGDHISTYDNSGIFGELALLYNVPRAASIQAVTEGLLWAMDRQTFRRILLKSAFKSEKCTNTIGQCTNVEGVEDGSVVVKMDQDGREIEISRLGKVNFW
ncbi:unnamed protein product [Ceratitis capitata]|uniref:(Mediterranean fruit fly) hypothetical protein n=1 Tax=Ceratitis capitata TaxID=7213 RepID=A0A811VEY8_CERCA|nr:unnamed protein product [Ceratitis capitata]